MKDGRIAHQGTFADIEDAKPDVYTGFQRALQMVTESETETENEGEALKLEQRLLKRQVSKQKWEEEGRKRAHTLLESGIFTGVLSIFTFKVFYRL